MPDEPVSFEGINEVLRSLEPPRYTAYCTPADAETVTAGLAEWPNVIVRVSKYCPEGQMFLVPTEALDPDNFIDLRLDDDWPEEVIDRDEKITVDIHRFGRITDITNS